MSSGNTHGQQSEWGTNRASLKADVSKSHEQVSRIVFIVKDSMTLPLLWLGLLLNMNGTFVPLRDAVLGACCGYLSLWLVYWAFKLITGREGMGYGDFKLLAALGAWLGWKMLLPIVLLSSLAGAILGMGLILLARRGRNIPIPFGPYLAIAGFVTSLYGAPIAARLGLG